MGLSSPDPNRTFLCYPADILELAKHLGISQFQVLSVSGGGPYAFACLKAIPRSMCIGGQIVSSIYPLSFGTNGMSFMHRSIMFLSYWAPGFVGTLMDWQIGSAARNPDRNVLKESLMKSMKYMPKRDQEALEQDDYLAALMDALRESFRDGGAGMGVESYLFAKDWGFELGDIDEHDIGLWHGKLDINCPFGMAQHAAGLLKASETHFLEEEAHSLASFHKDEILRSFLSSFT
jgi:pimeloyl-ACP methyl ester carboxylesterase